MKHSKTACPLVKIRRKSCLHLCLLAGVFLFSCAKSSLVREQLSRAEQLMETDSRAAALVLDSIDSSTLRGEEAALYAILRTQTDYKNYKPLTSDSLARVATDHYGTSLRKSYHAAMAWYTLGCVYTDQKKIEQAFDAYLKAKPLFPDTSDRYFSLCAQNIGRCYLERTLYKEAIEEFEESKQSSLLRHDSTQVAVCDYDAGLCYLLLKEFLSADSCLNSVLNNPHARKQLKKSILLEKAKIAYYYRGEADSAICLLHEYVRSLGKSHTVNAAYSILGNIYNEQDKLDSASFYYAKVPNDSNKIAVTYNHSRNNLSLYLRQHADEEHVKAFEHFSAISDSLFSARNRAWLIAVNNDHFHALKEERMKRKGQLFLAALLLLLMGSFWYITNWRRKRVAQYVKVYDQLKATQIREELLLKQQRAEMSQSNGPQNLQLFRDSIGVVVRQFMESPTWRIIFVLQNDDAEISFQERVAVCHDLNLCFADAFAILNKEGYALNHKEQLICACYALGLNSERTERVLGIKSSTIRVTKKRVKDKLPPDFWKSFFTT